MQVTPPCKSIPFAMAILASNSMNITKYHIEISLLLLLLKFYRTKPLAQNRQRERDKRNKSKDRSEGIQ